MMVDSRNLYIPVLGLVLVTLASTANAQTFEQSVEAARKVDAQYASQQAGVQGQRAQARQAGAAFWPYASVTYNSADLSAGASTTRTLSATQPLLSYDRYLMLHQGDSLVKQADAVERQANNDLVLRVLTSMSDIVRTRESIRVISVQIEGLQEQLNRAVRMRQLGQGTVTEVSDFDARLAISQANRVGLQNTLQMAERNFTLLTSLQADVANLSVEPAQSRPVDDRSFEELLVYARDNAPGVQVAKAALDQAEISAKRLKAQFLPQLSAQAVRSESYGLPEKKLTSVAITLSATLGATAYFDDQKASAEIQRAKENLRYAQETVAVDLVKQFVSVRSYGDEVVIRQRAVEAARVAVDANVKSYQGGIKTNSDVLTSYQNLADAEMALVTARLAKNEAGLRLKLLVDNV